EKQFEVILGKITVCYKLMKKDVQELPNDENKIRDVLVNEYINNPNIKRKLKLEYFVFPEVPETRTPGRTDIRIHSPNSFYNQAEYFIIECKRLDNINLNGSSGLNAQYIQQGICRFTSKHYTSYYRVNGMIGFIVEKIDISTNIHNINDLLINKFKESNTTHTIIQDNFIEGFPDHFHSIHKDTDDRPFKIYHLMFDLHENIQR
ncbi:MAG: hypothetical protein WD431_00975, partial [Cyclobacteriaceae bacterium]